MKVYLVEFEIPYEGTLGQQVFSTEEKAKAYVARQKPSNLGTWSIEEMTVDEEDK